MVSSIAPIRTMPTVEVQAAPVRLALRLAPAAYGAKVPRELVIEPHGEGMRMFASDGAAFVVIEAEGHCGQRVAMETAPVRKLLDRHSDAELFTVTPAANSDWSWRVRTYSPCMTAGMEIRRGEGIPSDAIERVARMGEGEEEGTAGSWSVMALRGLAVLLGTRQNFSRVGLAIAGKGPLVASFEGEGFRGRLVTMRLGEPD
jgi:hypothetical protein